MRSLKGFLGVDTGGTFTDFFWYGMDSVRIHKVLSTPLEPEAAILQGIEELGLVRWVREGAIVVVHGSTIATNAALEGRGVRTVYLTNRGFADTLTLARQNRPDIYAIHPKPVKPPVPPELCVEVDCRRDARGLPIRALDDAEIARVVEQIEALRPEAVAINLLFSYLCPEDERRVAAALPGDLFVSVSSDVLAEVREYERGIATWLNAWLGPVVESYLRRLQERLHPAPVAVMQSSGGTLNASRASRRAINLLLSGPAGGLAAARYVSTQIEQAKLITFDMGGTSTDVALIDGTIALTTEGKLGDYPVAVPMVDMHTIGAGGGSIAYVDAGGLLHVGPRSAGARPGPACYGLGGTVATVTDANAVLGLLRPDFFLGGRMSLQLDAARRSVGQLAEQLGVSIDDAARGIISLANEHMAKALRVISVQRGHDPLEFELCCFGGAGGLHVCALAEELGMRRVIVPANGGVFSAYGMLVAPRQRQLSRSLIMDLSRCDFSHVQRQADELVRQGREELESEGVSASRISERVSLDCRYSGQSFSLNVPMADTVIQVEQSFHKAHMREFGHQVALPVELVTVRVQVEAPSPLQPQEVQSNFQPGLPVETVSLPGSGPAEVWLRGELAAGQVLTGPAIICEEVSTTLVAPGWEAQLDGLGHLRLRRS